MGSGFYPQTLTWLKMLLSVCFDCGYQHMVHHNVNQRVHSICQSHFFYFFLSNVLILCPISYLKYESNTIRVT